MNRLGLALFLLGVAEFFATAPRLATMFATYHQVPEEMASWGWLDWAHMIPSVAIPLGLVGGTVVITHQIAACAQHRFRFLVLLVGVIFCHATMLAVGEYAWLMGQASLVDALPVWGKIAFSVVVGASLLLVVPGVAYSFSLKVPLEKEVQRLQEIERERDEALVELHRLQDKHAAKGAGRPARCEVELIESDQAVIGVLSSSPQSADDLARKIGLTPKTVRTRVSYLVENGLAVRHDGVPARFSHAVEGRS